MERANGFPLFMIGESVGIVAQSIVAFAKVGDSRVPAKNAHDQLETFIGYSNGLLPLSEDAAREVSAFLDTLLVLPNDATLEKGWKEGFFARLIRFRTMLSGEVPRVPTYLVTPKGIYATEALIGGAERFVSPGLAAHIPAESVTDVREAGRCFAFGMWTASAFHILRAAETVIRSYWEILSATTVKRKPRDWGAYIRSLQTLGAPAKVTGLIQQVKDFYRNPIMHPEQFVDEDSASILLGVALSTILQIAKEIAARSAEAAIVASAPAVPPSIP